MKPFSNSQKAALCQMARRAFNKLTSTGQISGIDLDTWRRDEVERVTGRPGLRECGNDDYRKLAAHFESLAGEDGRALNHLLASGTEKRRQLEVVLRRALQAAGLPIEYGESIALARWKIPSEDLSDHQFQQLLFTVKARCASRRRAAVRQPSPPND